MFLITKEPLTFTREVYTLWIINLGLIYQIAINIYCYKFFKKMPLDLKFLGNLGEEKINEFFRDYENDLDKMFKSKRYIFSGILLGLCPPVFLFF